MTPKKKAAHAQGEQKFVADMVPMPRADFSKVGGLDHHIKLLRDIIVLPLLYGELYDRFKIKPPRGIIFHGPPGTGKTLVAGALASEMSAEATGKVTFFHQSGGDILNKWVGESERNLREIFAAATRARPALIFFDELDGLAPVRSNLNDHVHASVVTTLLSLMDGLDNVPGIVVVGATNRIQSVDPALRRAGRFDRELYFAMPNEVARRDILRVHTADWHRPPDEATIDRLSQMTAGCCGSDLQALCSDAVLCCLKRMYPDISGSHTKVDIDLESLQVENEDFLKAHANIKPAVLRFGQLKMRALTPFIRPLLETQVERIYSFVHLLLPHFADAEKRYIAGDERFAGRLVLRGTNQQGLNNYVVPALLQRFEHLQQFVLDVPEKCRQLITDATHNLPSLLVLSRIDDWWDHLAIGNRSTLTCLIEEINAGMPVLLLVTFNRKLPAMLDTYFTYNSSIFIELENPNEVERGEFFSPLFFGTESLSLTRILQEKTNNKLIPILPPPVANEGDNLQNASVWKTAMRRSNRRGCGTGGTQIHNGVPWYNRNTRRNLRTCRQSVARRGWRRGCAAAAIDLEKTEAEEPVMEDILLEMNDIDEKMEPGEDNNKSNKGKRGVYHGYKSKNNDEVKIRKLWTQLVSTTLDLPVVHLELWYDALLAALYMNRNNFQAAVRAVQHTMESFNADAV